MIRCFKLLIAFCWLITFNALAENTLLLTENEKRFLSNTPTLRVGVHSIPRPPYWSGDALLPSGVVHDFSVLISNELNTPVEYVQYHSIPDVLNGISKGEIDLTIGYAKTPQREDNYLFTNPILNVDRVALIKNNMLKEKLSDLRWGCTEGSVSCKYLHDLGYENIFQFRQSKFYTEEILNTEIDAIIDTYDSLKDFISKNPTESSNFSISYNLGTYSVSMLVDKYNQNLKSILDKLIAKWFKVGDIENIYKKYNLGFYSLKNGYDNKSSEVTFKYTIKENLFPYFYWDEEEEQYSGYIYDLLNRISERTPVDFEFVPNDGRDEESMLASGLIDILPLYNAESVDEDKFLSTKIYTHSEYVLVRSKVSATDNIGILDRARIFRANEDTGDFIVYSSVDDMIEDLRSGALSLGYINNILAENLLLNDAEDVFDIVPTPKLKKLTVPLSMLVNAPQEKTLTLLNNALNTISDRESAALWRNYNRVDYNFGYDRQLVIVYVLIALGVALFCSLLFYKYYQKTKVKLERYYTNLVVSQGQVEWLSNVIDTIPYMVCIRGQDETVLLTNKKYKEMAALSGYDNEEALIYHLLSEVDADASSDYWQFVEVKDKDSKLFGQHYEIINKIIKSPNDTNIFVLTFFNDVTIAKEKELGLIESQRMANQLAEQKSQFVAVVSHELRTPISAMLGFMEILSQDYNRPDREMILSNAMYSANRLKYLVDDILDFSKLEANQLSISLNKGNLLFELCPVIRSFELLAKNKGLKFQFYWQPTQYIKAQADYIRLCQIINNVLSNAVKFTDSGLISVEITNDDKQLNLRFRDTGIGMSESQLSTLFEPFVQAEDTISRTYGGTGLGMSIVLSLVKLMDGQIDVQSALGLGTRISITIPMMVSKIDNSELNVSTSHSVTHPIIAEWYDVFGLPYQFKDERQEKKRIIYPDVIELFQHQNEVPSVEEGTSQRLSGRVLVVDDDVVNRVLLKTQLNEMGLAATLASTGLEAFEILSDGSEKHYDVLITDCHMPTLNGFGLTERVRSMTTAFKDMPIIGCTADNSLKTSLKAHDAGMNTILYKPYTLEDLHIALKEYINVEATTELMDLNNAWRFNHSTSGGDEMAHAIIESFGTTLSELTSGEGDIKDIAHKIKGSASILKHEELVQLCKQLEKQPSDHTLVDQLCTMLEQAIIEVTEYLDKQ